MKLHTKLVLSLVAGLVVFVVISQMIQFASLKKIVSNFSEENINLLKSREKEFALNMYKSIERAVAGSLERGEMDKFSQLLIAQNQIKGLLEFSLFDQNGIVRYSSKDAFQNKKMPEEVQNIINKSDETYLREAKDAIEIYQPQKIVPDCIRCHTRWKNGGLGGTTHFRFSTKALSQANEQSAQAISTMNKSIFWGSVAVVLFLIVIMSFSIFFLVRLFVSIPLGKTIEMLKNIAEGEGDLTKKLEVTSNDEVGEVAKWFNIFVNKIRKMIQDVQQDIQKLSLSSSNLKSISGEMAKKTDVMALQADVVDQAAEKTSLSIKNMAAAAEQVSSQVSTVSDSSESLASNMDNIGSATSVISNNLNTVAGAAEEMSHAVNNVATSIEEMYASLNEVAKNSGRGADMTGDASEKADETSNIVNALGDAAKEIGDVVDLIKGIAAQTNLLALNATIEAAGAGDAGKGFAVVANEVKELARQTAGATEEIREKVEGMQNNTNAAVNAIGDIVTSISEINTIMSTIASAVEEQTATTNEISKSISSTVESARSVTGNVHEAATSANETSDNLQNAIKLGIHVSENLAEVAKAAVTIAKDASQAFQETDKVSKNVTDLNESIDETSKGAASTNEHAEKQAALTVKLKNVIGQFKI